MEEQKQSPETAAREGYQKLTRTLIAQGLTITAMESATGGQLASLITDTEGSSAVLKGSFVTYSNEAKIRCGVPAEILNHYTVYSAETAAAMADAAYAAWGADLSVGVTGTMGNIDPANAAASVPGQVWFAIRFRGETKAFFRELEPQPTRLLYKLAVCGEILKELQLLLPSAE